MLHSHLQAPSTYSWVSHTTRPVLLFSILYISLLLSQCHSDSVSIHLFISLECLSGFLFQPLSASVGLFTCCCSFVPHLVPFFLSPLLSPLSSSFHLHFHSLPHLPSLFPISPHHHLFSTPPSFPPSLPAFSPFPNLTLSMRSK